MSSGYDPKERLENLIKTAGITQIILVDDDFDVEAEENGIGIEAAANVLEVNKNDKQKINKVKQLDFEKYGLHLFDIDEKLQGSDVRDNQLQEYWGKIPEREKERFFEIFNVENTFKPTENAADSLSKMLKGTVEVKRKKVTDWLEVQEELVLSHSETNKYILVLFDLSLKNINTFKVDLGRYDKAGYRLVKRVLDSENHNVIPGIMTNEAQNEQEELELSEEQFGMGITAAAVMKKRLQEPRHMVKGLEMVVAAHALYEMGLAVREAFEQVTTKKAWGNVELPALLKIAKNAEKEGCHASENLLRLMQSRSSDELSFSVREACKSNPSIRLLDSFDEEWYRKFLNSNRTLDEIDDMSLSYKDSYISGRDLAEHHMPTYLGDIYTMPAPDGISSDCYILLCQPCSISVRSDGTRKTQEQSLVLAKLAKVRKNKEGGIPRPKVSQSTTLLIPYETVDKAGGTSLDQSPLCCVCFLDYLHLPSWLLDLCVYNDDGKAKTFEQDRLSDGPLEHGWLQHGNTMLDMVKSKSEKYKELVEEGQLKENDEVTKLLHLAVFGLSELKWDITYDNNGQYDFGVRRIARLRSNIAEGILTEFARYQSRVAYPSQLL